MPTRKSSFYDKKQKYVTMDFCSEYLSEGMLERLDDWSQFDDFQQGCFDLITIFSAWENSKCMTIVLCSKGYPGSYQKNKIINLNQIKQDKAISIIHAGTKRINGKVYSNGGRVLNVVGKGKSFLGIRKKILKIIKKINWKSGFFRKDIGWRVIKEK